MLNQPVRRTVTTVGLPARKEQLIRSMLLAVSTQTVDTWSFSDEVEADVAICEVDSTLATVTAARARQAGRPQCVWLAPRAISAPDGRRLDDPIGSSSLIAILDDLSSELGGAVFAGPAALAPDALLIDRAAAEVDFSALEPTTTGSHTPFDLALTLRELLQQDSVETMQVSRGPIEVRLVASTKHVRLSHALGDEVLAGLLDADHRVRVERLSDPEAIRALPYTPPHIELLWRLGLAAGGDVLLPPYSAEHHLALARWPDFGKLTHTPAHVQLAARLVRRAHTVDELAKAAGVSVGEVVAFVNAAALCGLVVIRPSAAPAAVAVPVADKPAAPARPRGLFRSIRAALGLGGL